MTSFTANAFAELTPALRTLLAASPLFWLAAKELLRRHYYQRDGQVLQARREHRDYLALRAELTGEAFGR